MNPAPGHNRRPRAWVDSVKGWLDSWFPLEAGATGFDLPVQASWDKAMHSYRPLMLVADDNPAIQESTCELLLHWSITPMLAADGAEAVALACAHRFDLILMDLQMPILDGLGATRQIRLFELEHALPRVPVIAHTSAAFCLPGRLLPGCGVDAVLHKPCDASTLQDCMLRWCPPKP